MRSQLVLLVAVLSASIGIAGADTLKPPPTKEGLWETRGTHTQEGKTVADRPMKMCQSRETTKTMQDRGEEMKKQNECTSHVTQPSPNTFVEETRCAKGPSAGSVTKVVYTNQGDTASHTEVHMTVGRTETTVILDAKYVGTCPASMKPGDLMTDDGKVVAGAGIAPPPSPH